MKNITKLLICIGIMAAMTGCVVAPYGYHHGYYGPRFLVPAPVVVAPAVVVRPY